MAGRRHSLTGKESKMEGKSYLSETTWKISIQWVLRLPAEATRQLQDFFNIRHTSEVGVRLLIDWQ